MNNWLGCVFNENMRRLSLYQNYKQLIAINVIYPKIGKKCILAMIIVQFMFIQSIYTKLDVRLIRKIAARFFHIKCSKLSN